MTIGLFGGTFDPVHHGHLDVARAARQALSLDQVWFVPSRLPPHRATPHASAADRLAMTSLATDGEPGFITSDLEMNTPGPSYTSDTLDRLEERGIAPRDVCFIIGADAFLEIQSWKAYPHLLDRCHFAVVSRPGASAMSLPAALPALAARMTADADVTTAQPRIFLVDAPTAPVSSTEVRRRIATGQPLADLVPSAVAAYIHRHHLYATASAPAEPPQGAA